MAERFKAVVLKTTVAATSPGVRIPLAPLNSAVSWGGARVDDWGRLLSGCPGYTGPQVRILSSPQKNQRNRLRWFFYSLNVGAQVTGLASAPARAAPSGTRPQPHPAGDPGFPAA